MAAKRRAETMEETRTKLITAARKAFAEKGFAAASMDDLTASVGLTRGALYHNFGDKKGCLPLWLPRLTQKWHKVPRVQRHSSGMTSKSFWLKG